MYIEIEIRNFYHEVMYHMKIITKYLDKFTIWRRD